MSMWDMTFWLLILAAVAVLIILGGVAARSFMAGQSPTAAFFGPKPDPRIYVIEQANVDGRRRLLLIRRDDVEHLIMTGGPVDVVIETNIKDGSISSSNTASNNAESNGAATEAPPGRTFTTAESQARAFGQRGVGLDG
jgi:flagellar protein FliO/FliZ